MPDRLEQQRRRKGPECLSDYQIDCLVASNGGNGSLDESGRRWRAHVESCGLCSEKLERSNTWRSRFAQEHPLAAYSSSTLAKIDDKARTAFWTLPKWVGILSGAGAAAVILIIALSPPLREDGTGRVKGDASFGVYVKRGEAVFKGDSGGVYLPGDRLRFYHSNAEPRHLAILDLESTGSVSVFVPPQGDQPILVPEAREKILPGSIELDDSEGREQLVGIFCAAPFELAAVRERLAKQGMATGGSSDSRDLGLSSQCSIMRFTINKARPR